LKNRRIDRPTDMEQYGHALRMIAPTPSLKGLLARVYSRAALPYLAVIVLVAVAVVMGGREIAHHIKAVEAWVSALGPWGVLAFVVLYAIASSCLFPDSILCIAAGAMFGLGWGIPAVLAGALLGSSLQFALSHHLLKQRIGKVLAARPSLAAIQRAVMRDEFRLQVLLRLTPLNPATISYVLGATGVRFAGFITACLALTPHLAVGVYFGRATKHATLLASETARSARLHDLVLGVGLLTCIVVMVVISRMARKALTEAVEQACAAAT
jgi:uncharacterized membrane protein YdjX (TVP38/TMEM64 family)